MTIPLNAKVLKPALYLYVLNFVNVLLIEISRAVDATFTVRYVLTEGFVLSSKNNSASPYLMELTSCEKR